MRAHGVHPLAGHAVIGAVGRDRRVILIGRTGSGKTTLIRRIERLDMAYRKTQTVQSYPLFIDTPGEYLENRGYYKALLVSSADADVIGLVQDCTGDESWLPPQFAAAFAKPVVGIVTKIDLAESEARVRAAEAGLRRAGAGRLFRVSAVTGEGVGALTKYIRQGEGGGEP